MGKSDGRNFIRGLLQLKSTFKSVVKTIGSWFDETNVLTYIYRGLKYALTSAAAIFAGYLMQSRDIKHADILILSIPATASWLFFICYANRFDLKKATDEQGLRIQSKIEANAVIVFVLIEALWISVALLWAGRSGPLPWKLLRSLGIYVVLFVAYGIFLLSYHKKTFVPPIRHMLIWPVVLAIALGLYCGLSFSALADSDTPLPPAGLIVAFFLASTALGLRKNIFLWSTLTSILVITVFLVLNLFGVNAIPSPLAEYLSAEYLSLIFFCIAASAYLAVFEAWKITAYVATIEPNVISSGSLEEEGAVGKKSALIHWRHGALHLRKSSEYALATLAALTVTVLVLPLYFVFSDYGNEFLIFFALHALIGFVYWFRLGRGRNLKRSWDKAKALFGLIFLGILVLAPKKNASPVEYLAGFADWGVWIGFAVLTAFTLPGLISDIIKQRGDTRRSYLLGLFRNRVNFTRLLSLLCVIPAAVTVSLSKSPHALAARQYRAELAFYVYVLCIVFCLIIELMYNVGQGRKRWRVKHAAKNIVGFLLLIRIATSSAIALVVILPLLHEGSSITRSFLAAIPFFLAAAGGFALNDYYDAEKDRINKPYRALPSGRINPGVVKSIAFTLIGSASFAAILVSHNTFQLALYSLSILGVTFYNYLVKHITLSKSLVTALVSTLPLLYVVVTLDYPKTYVFIPASSLVFLIGREWLMDVRDIAGDATAGIATLPISIGSMRTAILSFGFFFASFALLVPHVVTIQTWWAIGFLLVMIGSTVMLALFWWVKCGVYRRAVVLGLWVPMSCGILMLIR